MGALYDYLILAVLIYPTQAQSQNQLTNFCRRFSHQTTVIDDKLFIDGGYVNFGGGIDSNTVNYTNTRLLYADLSIANEDRFPEQYDNLAKPAYVPSVAGGALWADSVNKLFYLYGGEYNSSLRVPAQFTLWQYDAIYNTWNTTDTDPAGEGIQPAAHGASAVDPNLGVAYYYGGWHTNLTQQGYTGNSEAESRLISYDYDEKTWRQNTFIDDTPRAEGGLYYIPASDAGMLVYFGGVQLNASGNYSGVPMDTIYLYDIGSQKSYSQSTSGTSPSMRRRFAGGVSWPEDRSSYNIYFFGGLPPYEEDGYGFSDVWILSIPSFTWVKYYADNTGQHHSLSADVVRNGQMLLIGGYWPDASYTACDASMIWGSHNLNLGSDNDEQKPWYHYLPSLTKYSVPPNLTAVIGGSPSGGASLVTPAAGFGNNDLETYFGRRAPTGSRTATRPIPTDPTDIPPPQPGPNVGAIAGGVLGGLAVLALLVAGSLICLRRRKRNTPDQPRSSGQVMTNAPAHDSSMNCATHKSPTTGPSYPSSPGMSLHHSPTMPPHQQQTVWQQPQQYYPPPQQNQHYFPPPPVPQLYPSPSPVHEMGPRSPLQAGDGATPPGRWRSLSAGASRTIDEE